MCHALYKGFLNEKICWFCFFSVFNVDIDVFKLIVGDEIFYLFNFVFLFNIVISLVYSYIFREDFFNLNRLVNNYSRLYDVFDFVGNYSFSSVNTNH